jgi:hypothetical protein
MSRVRVFGSGLVLVAFLMSGVLRPAAGCWSRTACSMHGDVQTCRLACAARKAAPKAEQSCHAREPQPDCSLTASCDRTDDATAADLIAVLATPVELAPPGAAEHRDVPTSKFHDCFLQTADHPPRLFAPAV